MKITRVDCHVLLVPDLREDATSSAQDDFVVFVHTDTGIIGVGESDAVSTGCMPPDLSLHVPI